MHAHKKFVPSLVTLSLGALMCLAPASRAQLVTNWTAYNDHTPGTQTAANANRYNLRGIAGSPPEPTSGPLRDFTSGQLTPAIVISTAEGSPDFFGTSGYPAAGSPAFNLFNGIVDVGNQNSMIGVRGGPPSATTPTTTTITFTNLDPDATYIFRGTAVRGNATYTRRWSVHTIRGAVSFSDAHTPGVATASTFPSGGMTNGQAALNSGANTAGDVVGWDNIRPGPDGSFSIYNQQYTNSTMPNGQTPDLTVYGYAINAFVLIETGIPYAPILLDTTQPTNQVVLQSRPTTLRILARGSPQPTYQWYRNGVPIDPLVNPSATTSTYVISQMTEADAGDYYAVATNPSGSTNSRTATISYIADTVAPTVLRAVGSPTFDRITVEFSEVMDSQTVTDAVNYAVSPALTVYSAQLTPGRDAVILTTDPQTPDTVYTVTANQVYDLSGNPTVSPNDTANFRSWVNSPSCSGVLFERFNSTATTIAAFTNSPNYPNNPTASAFINRMHSRAIFPDNSNDNYGGRMRALFVPLVSGNWRFFMSSDDPGELWINPNGSSPSGRIRAAFELGCCGLYMAPGASQTSAAFPMTAGQAYYIELIYKENTGGDYGMVAARLDGTGVPPGGNDQTGEPGEAINGAVVASPFCTVATGAVPSGAAGSLSIVQDLSNVSAEANTRVTLTVGASAPNSPYICYQWQKSDDGGATFADIPGATRPSHTTPFLTEADDHNDVYRLVAGIPGAQVTSANAVLSVTADVTAPRVVRVVAISASQIAVVYSEPMIASSSATDPFAYEIDGGTIVVAECITNINTPARIDLMISPTTPMTVGNVYELRISTDSTLLTDFAGNPLNPTPTRITFRSMNYTGNPETLIALPTNTMRALGSLTARGMAGRMVQISANFSPPLLPITEQVLAGAVIDPTTSYPYPNIAPQPAFIETSTINYGDTPTGLGTGRLLPDRAFPGYTAAANNMAMEVLAYLELSRGIYRMGVNSDDDFRVTPATSVSDPNGSIVLGQFSGGRGPADTTFDFEVTQDGLYPFRLIWAEYQGGATCEWWIQSLIDASYIGVNGSDLIKAFLPPQPRVNVARAGATTSVSWVDAVTLQDAPAITGPWTDSANQLNPQDVEVYGAKLDGAQDGGGARTGTGTASLLLSGNQVTIYVTYSGLSGTVSAAHIHSPAPRGGTAGVLYGLTPVPAGGQAGTINQTITLVDKAPPFGTVAEQITQLRNGLWYINIHTSPNFGGGEIRGQVEAGGMRFFRARE